jgi:hypothetical protein
MDLYTGWPDGRIKVGATLTFRDPLKSRQYEPGAAPPSDRIHALREVHNAGVKTWASIEPVIDPEESLAIIEDSLPYVDQYKVGKLNHTQTETDWTNFGGRAVAMIRAAGKELYVKDDLRCYIEAELTDEECTADALCLPRRPAEPVLL